MKCPKCKAEIPDGMKFCMNCGAPAPEKKGGLSKGAKKGILIGCTAAVVAAGVGLGSWMGRSMNSGNSYEAAIAAAEKYMETQDYDKAEEALLEAKKIDPKRSDTYEQLYSLYSNQGDEEQLVGLVEEAQTVLDQQENDTFTQNVNEMAEAGQAVPIEEVMNAAADTIQYSKHMNEAMDSLEQADVATAVRLLNSAIEINPARSDAYLLLYQVLIESGDVIEAQQVVADAHASLPDSEQEEFDTQLANVTRPEEDGKTDPGWTKVADLGPLDFTPIEIGEQGWLIAADGVYGFVTPQGKVTRTDRKLSCEILLKNSQAKIPESIQSVSLRADDQGKQYEITKDLHEAKAVPVKKEEKPSSAKKEEKPAAADKNEKTAAEKTTHYALNEKLELIVVGNTSEKIASQEAPIAKENNDASDSDPSAADAAQDGKADPNAGADDTKKASGETSANEKTVNEKAAIQQPAAPILVRVEKKAASDEKAPAAKDKAKEDVFYIYNPVNRKAYGPYDAKQIPCFALIEREVPAMSIVNTENYALGPFLALNTDRTFTIISADGKKSKEGILDVSRPGLHGIGTYSKKGFEMLDGSLKVEYAGEFEDGGWMIRSVAPVKINGKWKLVRFDQNENAGVNAISEAEEKTQTPDEKDSAELKAKEEKTQDQKKEDEPSQAPAEAADGVKKKKA